MSNTLFITEGSKTEPLFLNNIWKKCIKDSAEIYSYRTNIHVLMGELFSGDSIDEDIDLLQHIISREKDQEEKKRLGRRFTDIFLVFDLDMQDVRADMGKLETMMRSFRDSADNGKLYINYPMVESYRHLRSLNDGEFRERCIAVSRFPEYKNIVSEECSGTLKDVTRYDRGMFRAVIEMHLKKANYILGGGFELPSLGEFGSWEGADILNAQRKKMEKDGSVYVLNTSLFNVVDYRPSDFLRK